MVQIIGFNGCAEVPIKAIGQALSAYHQWYEVQEADPTGTTEIIAITPTESAGTAADGEGYNNAYYSYSLLVQYRVTPAGAAPTPIPGLADALPVHYTERSFPVADFLDRHGRACSIQDSSVATEPCIWLGLDEMTEANPGTRMHLTQDTARRLLPLIAAFAEHGTIAPTED